MSGKNTLTAGDIKTVFQRIASMMEEKRDWLGELDGEVGDGDLGLTMSSGFRKAADALRDLEEQDVGKLLARAGVVIGQSAPSTMGTLIATGFMRGGKALQGKDEMNLADLAQMLHAFVEGIMARGKANPGEKTIIDSIHPAAQALDEAVAAGRPLKEGLQAAYTAAERGVEATKAMISQHGRAAYYQERSLGKQDPGATVGMLLLKGFADYVGRA